jgi:hypothetical protein
MDIIPFLNYNSGLITAIATAVLALITACYLNETRKIRLNAEKLRIESRKPILSFQSSDYPRSDYQGLYLCNYGSVARNVSIITTCEGVVYSKLFLYTLGQRDTINICGEWNSAKMARKKIVSEINFQDADLKSYTEKIVVDFEAIPTGQLIAVPLSQPVRVDCYRMKPL